MQRASGNPCLAPARTLSAPAQTSRPRHTCRPCASTAASLRIRPTDLAAPRCGGLRLNGVRRSITPAPAPLSAKLSQMVDRASCRCALKQVAGQAVFPPRRAHGLHAGRLFPVQTWREHESPAADWPPCDGPAIRSRHGHKGFSAKGALTGVTAHSALSQAMWISAHLVFPLRCAYTNV